MQRGIGETVYHGILLRFSQKLESSIPYHNAKVFDMKISELHPPLAQRLEQRA